MSSRFDHRCQLPKRIARDLLAAAFMLFGSYALAGPVTCTSSASQVAVDPADTFAELGELSLACGGGTASDPPLTFTLQAFFNTNVLDTVTPVLSVDNTTYAADFVGSNSIRFTDVMIDPVAALMTLSDVFIDATLLPPSSGMIPTQVIAFISMGGIGAPMLSNPQLAIGVLHAAPTSVPEPPSSWLFWLGAAAFGGLLARKMRPRRLSNGPSNGRDALPGVAQAAA